MLERRRPVMAQWAAFLDGERWSVTVVPFADKRR
jgi:hypothetical protein